MVRTLLNEAGLARDVIALQLAHSERNKVRAAYNKSQLHLDHIRRKPLLVEERARHTAKSVSGLFVAGVPQPPQGSIDGVIRHRAIESQERRKHVAPAPCERLELAQNRQRLLRERHDVL